MSTVVLWFRRDLRLSDHPALHTAIDLAGPSGSVLPLFCVDPALWGPAGTNRRAFLAGCLRELDESIGGRLVVREGAPADIVPSLAAEVDAAAVVVTEDFGPLGRQRDGAVADALLAAGRPFVVDGSPYAVAPGTILNGTGRPYKVFTPFSKAWTAVGWAGPLRAPGNVSWTSGIAGRAFPEAAADAVLPEPGEAAAKRVARRFWDGRLADYDTARDDPGRDATSRLSPYLRWGCIHPRQLLAKLGRGEADRRFRLELAWREFYADVLHHRPETARVAFNPAMQSMEVDTGADTAEGFQAWCTGRTGYPIVDAGMRQLLAEGWMHNRVRMLTASFLVKDLHLDWTRGARWFMDQLVDGDLASNQHGWQWVAGTGTDAAPYFRVFSPYAQGERFDPDGTYVRRWVPELRDVADRYVHRPWTDPGGPPLGYPAPIVDHATEREESLRRYAAVRGATR
jgi:deoxyribodipyrimidine photo-lyase